MKTKFKFLSVLTVALLLGFSSCSNDDAKDNTDNGEKKSLYFKLDKEAIAKSEGSAVLTGAKVTLSSGRLYFVNSGGTIIDTYTLSSAATNLGAGIINITDAGTSGVTISNLPGSVTAAHVFGNVPNLDDTGATLTMPTSGSINTVKALNIGIASQVNTASCNLYGTAGLVLVSGINYTCDVILKPTIARIELSDITASGDIENFTVEGIFLDKYEKAASIGGTTGIYSLVNNGVSPTNFVVGGGTPYPATDRGVTFDDNNGSGYVAVSKVATPNADVWGYNLFAVDPITGNTSFPSIVIRLKNITTSGNSTPGAVFSSPQFITIKGLYTVNVGDLGGIQAGKVYKVSLALNAIEPEDLAPVPNVDAISVKVTVTVAEWETVDVKPEI